VVAYAQPRPRDMYGLAGVAEPPPTPRPAVAWRARFDTGATRLRSTPIAHSPSTVLPRRPG